MTYDLQTQYEITNKELQNVNALIDYELDKFEEALIPLRELVENLEESLSLIKQQMANL